MGKKETVKDFMFSGKSVGDFVRCCNCGELMLVEAGTEACPHCGSEDGTLAWADDELQESDIEHLETVFEVEKAHRKLEVGFTYDGKPYKVDVDLDGVSREYQDYEYWEWLEPFGGNASQYFEVNGNKGVDGYARWDVLYVNVFNEEIDEDCPIAEITDGITAKYTD